MSCAKIYASPYSTAVFCAVQQRGRDRATPRLRESRDSVNLKFLIFFNILEDRVGPGIEQEFDSWACHSAELFCTPTTLLVNPNHPDGMSQEIQSGGIQVRGVIIVLFRLSITARHTLRAGSRRCSLRCPHRTGRDEERRRCCTGRPAWPAESLCRRNQLPGQRRSRAPRRGTEPR